MLVFATLVSQIFAKCVDISSTHVCAPYSHLKIDVERLSKIYGVDKELDASSWEELVLRITQGGHDQALMWKNWAQCSGYEGEYIQYYRSYVCMTDIFEFSADCNKDVKAKPLCSSVCEDYGAAVHQMILDEDVCPDDFGSYDKQVYKSVYERRKMVLDAARSCEKLLDLPVFEKAECVYGVESDAKSCGFSGDVKVAEDYCSYYPGNECCRSLGQYSEPTATPTPTETPTTTPTETPTSTPVSEKDAKAIFDPVERVALIWGIGSDAATGDEQQQAPSYIVSNQNTTIVIVATVAGVVLLAIAAFIFERKRRAKNKANAGLKRLKSRNKAPAVAPQEPVNYPPGTKLIVKFAYTQSRADEIDLHPGDVIELLGPLDAQWATFRNLTTNLQGSAPISYAVPITDAQ
ncbi:hypothetical protein EDD86DRAFT_273534 [Gorgonomyces haynaldii]|nr:hypothetical protein EDD86DRAFT_273534 [Gorgonomyces haynaldii]